MAKIQCKNCKQFKLQRRSDLIGGGGLIAAILGLILSPFIIGIPVAVIGVGMFGYGLFMRFTGRDKFVCKNCKFEQKIS
jgi:hypothetical protein